MTTEKTLCLHLFVSVATPLPGSPCATALPGSQMQLNERSVDVLERHAPEEALLPVKTLSMKTYVQQLPTSRTGCGQTPWQRPRGVFGTKWKQNDRHPQGPEVHRKTQAQFRHCHRYWAVEL